MSRENQEYVASETYERYVIGEDFNTKDWFVYDNETDSYICYCDTKEEAEEFVKKLNKEE